MGLLATEEETDTKYNLSLAFKKMPDVFVIHHKRFNFLGSAFTCSGLPTIELWGPKVEQQRSTQCPTVAEVNQWRTA